MATNVHFSKGTISEQYLYEDLVIEAIGIYGHDVYYLPRDRVNEDVLLGEDPLSQFDDAYGIEMWMETQEGYEGEKDLVTRFGLEIRNETSFAISRRRWDDVVSNNANLITTTRPQEGDLIYFPTVKRMWEITFVDHDDPFYQVDNLPIYRMSCSLFEYSSEILDTGIVAVDVIEDTSSTDALFYQFTLEQTVDYNENMALEDGTGLLLEETDGDNILSETDSAGASLITEYGDYLISEEYVIDTIDENAQNVFIQTEADSIINFTEKNPFGEM